MAASYQFSGRIFLYGNLSIIINNDSNDEC